MLNFLRSLFKSLFKNELTDRRPSSVIAKNRLTVVLVQDRAGLTSKELEQFKKELLVVLEKYFVIDVGGFDIEYKRQGEYTVLTISSPVIVKRSSQDDIKVLESTSQTSEMGNQVGRGGEIEIEVERSSLKEKPAAHNPKSEL